MWNMGSEACEDTELDVDHWIGPGVHASMTQLVMVEPEGPRAKKLLADRLSMDQQKTKRVEPVARTFG